MVGCVLWISQVVPSIPVVVFLILNEQANGVLAGIILPCPCKYFVPSLALIMVFVYIRAAFDGWQSHFCMNIVVGYFLDHYSCPPRVLRPLGIR